MSAPGTVAMPFMVASTAVGYPSSAPDENAKGEVWAPLWSCPATLPEVARLIGEGRSTWNRRQASTGLDFARAAASLGVDRGIEAFARHALVERHGQSMLAVPVGRFAVTARPQIPVLRQLDGWLDRVRGTSRLPPGRRRPSVAWSRRCSTSPATAGATGWFACWSRPPTWRR